MTPPYYDPVGRSLKALLVIAIVCLALSVGTFALDVVTPGSVADSNRPFAQASGLLFAFGLFGLLLHYATAAIVGAIRGRGQ